MAGYELDFSTLWEVGLDIKVEQKMQWKMKQNKCRDCFFCFVYVPSDSIIQHLQGFIHAESVNPP